MWGTSPWLTAQRLGTWLRRASGAGHGLGRGRGGSYPQCSGGTFFLSQGALERAWALRARKWATARLTGTVQIIWQHGCPQCVGPCHGDGFPPQTVTKPFRIWVLRHPWWASRLRGLIMSSSRAARLGPRLQSLFHVVTLVGLLTVKKKGDASMRSFKKRSDGFSSNYQQKCQTGRQSPSIPLRETTKPENNTPRVKPQANFLAGKKVYQAILTFLWRSVLRGSIQPMNRIQSLFLRWEGLETVDAEI